MHSVELPKKALNEASESGNGTTILDTLAKHLLTLARIFNHSA
jgi:hypothetical protein